MEFGGGGRERDGGAVGDVDGVLVWFVAVDDDREGAPHVTVFVTVVGEGPMVGPSDDGEAAIEEVGQFVDGAVGFEGVVDVLVDAEAGEESVPRVEGVAGEDIALGIVTIVGEVEVAEDEAAADTHEEGFAVGLVGVGGGDLAMGVVVMDGAGFPMATIELVVVG